MTSPAENYAPRDPDYIDNIRYTERVVDQILRNNPLVNAVVSKGLTQWVGRYTDVSGQKKPFMWLGEFFPADSNLPGSPPQMGVVAFRDGPGSSAYAIAVYDHNPGGGGGLTPTIHMKDASDKDVMIESRPQGGLWFPSTGTGWTSRDSTTWPQTTSATGEDIWETHIPITGARIGGFLEGGSFTSGAGEIWLRVEPFFGGGPAAVESPHLIIPAGGRPLVAIDVDVSTHEGQPAKVKVMGKRTSGAGSIGGIPLGVNCKSTSLL